MKQSVIVVLMFALGCIVAGGQPMGNAAEGWSIYILYALMFQVGVSIGCSGNMREVFARFRPKMLLLPLATLSGTLLMSAAVGLLLTRWDVMDVVAVGGGMGYYSLSSVLIAELKADTLGEQVAVELATIALLANVLREIFALTLAPLFRRFFSPFGPIAAAGVTSVDVSLPVIGRVCGQEMMAVAVFHGLVLDLSLPFMLPLLCEW